MVSAISFHRSSEGKEEEERSQTSSEGYHCCDNTVKRSLRVFLEFDEDSEFPVELRVASVEVKEG